MMQKGTRLGLTLFIVVGVVALTAWQFWPDLAGMVSGRVRQHLPSPVLAMISEPLPAALPAPQQPARLADVDLLLDPLPTSVPLPTAVPLPTTAPLSAAPASDFTNLTEAEVAPTAVVAASTAAPPAPAIAADPTPTVIPGPTSRLLPAQVSLAGVQIVPQKFNNCGPANLSMVLAYHGLSHNQLEVAAVIRPTYEDRNVSPHELAAYVTDRTALEAAVFHGGTAEQLRALLAAGLPVIVEKGLEDDGTSGWMGHYLTLYGYDDTASQFQARDTFLGPWDEDGYEPYDGLVRQWHQFNNVLIVVYDPAMRPVVADILGAGLDSPTTMWDNAIDLARAVVRANPGDAFAWFNLGSSLVGKAQLSGDGTTWNQAAASFDQARLYGLPARMLWYQFAPYDAYLAVGRARDVVELAEATLATQGGRSVEETFLYLGHAYQALGDHGAARTAYGQAVALSPTSPVAAAAQTELARQNP